MSNYENDTDTPPPVILYTEALDINPYLGPDDFDELEGDYYDQENHSREPSPEPTEAEIQDILAEREALRLELEELKRRAAAEAETSKRRLAAAKRRNIVNLASRSWKVRSQARKNRNEPRGYGRYSQGNAELANGYARTMRRKKLAKSRAEALKAVEPLPVAPPTKLRGKNKWKNIKGGSRRHTRRR